MEHKSSSLETFVANVAELERDIPEQAKAIIRNITTIPCWFYDKRTMISAMRSAGMPKVKAKALAAKAVETNKMFHRYLLNKSRQIHEKLDSPPTS